MRVQDVRRLTAAQRVAAYGLEGERFPFGPDPEFVDVLQFETSPLMVLTTPDDREERPWPTYPLGFLRYATPVWDLDFTRVTTGARYVRIGRDGSQRVFSEYDGAARGWRGAKGYLPPLWLAGPRARWNGLDLPASYTVDQAVVELVWVGDEGVPAGFEQVRPRSHARVVPVAECESVFEVVVSGRWRDAPVRVLQHAGDQSLLLLSEPDLESVNRLGAHAGEASIFSVVAPSAEHHGWERPRTVQVRAIFDRPHGNGELAWLSVPEGAKGGPLEVMVRPAAWVMSASRPVVRR